MQSLKVKRQYC